MNQPASPLDISAQIKRKARNLGFADCRITSADPAPERDQAALFDWLDQGMHGDMRWFERSKKARADIQTRFPWAKSVVVLRCEYAADRLPSPASSDQQSALLSRTARYAQGLDYHEFLAPKLKKLQAIISKFDDGDSSRTGCEALWYQDTGPILEHVYAERAGLGWTGKHTLTLNEHAGSYFFLAEVITSLELAPDAPATNHCGTCTACIDACPTDAIFEPYKLDARRCISYLTIEHKEAVAPELRDQLAGLVFGCDICQEVCPYNKKRLERDGPRTIEEEWRAPLVEALTIESVMMKRDSHLLEALAGSPMERTGPARLKRNAALIIGSERMASGLKGLKHCITHHELMVRESCAWALGRFAGTPQAEEARKALVAHQKHESEESIRDVVIEALQAFGAPANTKRPISDVARKLLEMQAEKDAAKSDEILDDDA